jgi:hypothetical protein
MGHDIAPGASYCAQGHPIALDQMQFNNDQYGGPPGGGFPPPAQPGFGAAPPPPAPAYGAPPPAPGFGPPPQAPGGFPPPAGGGFGAPPPAPGFGPPPQAPGFPPPAQPGFGGPPPAPAAGFGGAPAFGGPGPDANSAAPAKIVRGFLVAYGSNEGIDISLQDPTISSRHAAVVVDGPSGAVAVEDTGSTNGTFVNDEHIGFNGRRELRDGDRLRFGGFTTIVKVIGRV